VGEKMTMQWYIVQSKSNCEKSVQKSLLERAAQSGLSDYFGQIIVPIEDVVELKNTKSGQQKVLSERKFFPGYVFVEMVLTDKSWHLVKHTQNVSGFLGGTNIKPIPMKQIEIDAIIKQMQTGVEKPKPKIFFKLGQMLRIKDGPFTDFNGLVEDVNYDKNKVRVAVTIFGRQTPVELDFSQVEPE